MILRRLLPLVAALMLVLPAQVRAEVTDVSQAIAVEILPGWRRADGSHVAGLRLRLAPGWKTYWRAAGAAGIAPQMDWRGSRNLRSVTPAWPTPTVFRTAGALSIGYDREFILPLVIAAGSGPIDLVGEIDIGVCKDICLPARLSLKARLGAQTTPDRQIEAALSDRPRRINAAARCTLQPVADGFAITGLLDVPSQGPDEAVVFEPPSADIWVTDATVRRDGRRIEAQARMYASGRGAVVLDRSRLRITVIGRDGAVEVMGCTG